MPGTKEGEAITQAELKQYLSYEPMTGVFVWRPSGNMRRRMWNKVAGSLHYRGYIHIELNGHHYAAHRLAWLYMTGEWPPNHIDHINMSKSDNRWSNLRAATKSQNHANRAIFQNNRSGFKWVRFEPRNGQWQARITLNYRQKHLGYFADPETAHKAYCRAAEKTFGEFGRGA
jgi:hypothetical protein